MKLCQICGKPIEFTSRAKKYCSPACRARAKYEKDRAWLSAHPGKSAEYGRKFYAEHAEERKQLQRDMYRNKCLERYKKSESGEN